MSNKKKLITSEYLKKRNVKRFSLFFIIAFVFLIFSKLSNDYKHTIKLKVNLENVDEEVILKNDSLSQFEAYIEAKGFALVPYMFNNSKTIELDAKTDIITKSEHFIFDVQKHKFLIEEQFGSSYKVHSVKPDTLVLNYSKRASKNIPVDLVTAIEFASGFDILDNFVLSTDSVKVVGSFETVDTVRSISTKELVLKDINTDISESISFESIEGLEIFPKAINVKAEVKRFTEGTIEIPITIINKPANTVINYFPKTVTVLYYVDLDNYNSIEVSDFGIECDYEAIENNQTYLIPEVVRKPEFVKRINLKQKRIDFIKL